MLYSVGWYQLQYLSKMRDFTTMSCKCCYFASAGALLHAFKQVGCKFWTFFKGFFSVPFSKNKSLSHLHTPRASTCHLWKLRFLAMWKRHWMCDWHLRENHTTHRIPPLSWACSSTSWGCKHNLKSAQRTIFDLVSFVLFLSEIIDDLAHLVDKTDSRIRNETRRVKLVDTKSASCGEPLSDLCPNCSKSDIN